MLEDIDVKGIGTDAVSMEFPLSLWRSPSIPKYVEMAMNAVRNSGLLKADIPAYHFHLHQPYFLV